MDYFCPKSTFLQLKHYMQRIYLILLSTTCVKIYGISYVIFETISQLSRHNSSAFFLAQTLHTFNKSSPSKCKFSDFLLFVLESTKLPMSFVKQKSQFFFKVWITLQCPEVLFFTAFFKLKIYMLLAKVAHQSAIFQTCDIHVICQTKKSVFLQSLDPSSVS